MPSTIIIRGPLGVGKTTIARALAERLNGEYISIDDVLDRHGLDQVENGIPARNFLRANTLLLPAARAALARGQAVILDGNFYYRSQMSDLARRLPAPPLIFTLQATLETCIARDRGRERVYGEDSTAWVYYLVSRVPAGISVETDGKTQEEVIAEIQRRILSTG